MLYVRALNNSPEGTQSIRGNSKRALAPSVPTTTSLPKTVVTIDGVVDHPRLRTSQMKDLGQ
jgi:hypothetical protein